MRRSVQNVLIALTGLLAGFLLSYAMSDNSSGYEAFTVNYPIGSLQKLDIINQRINSEVLHLFDGGKSISQILVVPNGEISVDIIFISGYRHELVSTDNINLVTKIIREELL